MDDNINKALFQLQSQYQEAGRQLATVRAQAAGRERDKKLTTLTLREIETLPRDPPVTCYRGVGRMFVQESRNNIENTLRGKAKEVDEELKVLEKKHKYLESEMNTAQGSLRDLLQEVSRQQQS